MVLDEAIRAGALGACVAVPAVLVWRELRGLARLASMAARRAARRATLTSGIAGVLLLLVNAFVVLYPHHLFQMGLGGPQISGTPLASLLIFLAVYAVGELTWPRPEGGRREARLTARTPARVAPPLARRLVWGWLGALAVVTVVFGLMASGPRHIARVFGDDKAFTVRIFPGWEWAGPVLAAGILVVACTELVLRLVAVRPAASGVDPGWDLWLRRRTTRRALGGVQLVIGLTVAGLVVIGGRSLLWLGNVGPMGVGPRPEVSEGYIIAGGAGILLGLSLAVAAVAAACWPSRDPAPDVLVGAERAGVPS